MAGMSAASGEGTKSRVKILANIFISFIGAGVLGLPYAFKESGILEGVMIMVFVSVVCTKAMIRLVDCKYMILDSERPKLDQEHGVSQPLVKYSNGDLPSPPVGKGATDGDTTLFHHSVNQLHKFDLHERELTYGDVGFKALGLGRSLVDTNILISQVGFCCAYLIFITENLSTYVDTLTKFHWLVIILPPLFFLCLLKDLSSLAISSLFAQFSNLFAFLVVFWFDFEHASNIRTHPKQMSIEGFPFFFAMAIYCYEGAGLILSLEASVHKSIRHKFKSYLISTLSLVTLLYVVFGACGYMSFGSETSEIITLNLPHSGRAIDFAMVVKLCLCLSLFFTYPVMMFPVSRLLDVWCNNSASTFQTCLVRLLLVSTTGIVVVIIPNFAHLMALVGATCCMLLGFILPALFHTKLKIKISYKERCMDMFLIGLGLVGIVIGLSDAVKRLYEEDTTDTTAAPTLLDLVPLSISANLTTSPS